MKIKLVLLALTASLTLTACQDDADSGQVDSSVALDNQAQKLSYLIGMDTGGRFSAQPEIELDREAFLAGFDDALAGSDPRLSQEELTTVVQEFQQQQQGKQEQATAERQEAMRLAAENNAAEGKAFLEENSGKEGVVTTETGLQYKVLQVGAGAMPDAASTVEVKYRGRLIDGTEFDASENHGGSVELRLDQVIPGWTEALQKMQEGAVWELYIPADLAYGPSGTSGLVGPNATLIFEVELINVVAE